MPTNPNKSASVIQTRLQTAASFVVTACALRLKTPRSTHRTSRMTAWKPARIKTGASIIVDCRMHRVGPAPLLRRKRLLLFHDFLRFLVRHLVDLALESLEQPLHFFLALVALVLGHLLVLLGLVEMFVAV